MVGRGNLPDDWPPISPPTSPRNTPRYIPRTYPLGACSFRQFSPPGLLKPACVSGENPHRRGRPAEHGPRFSPAMSGQNMSRVSNAKKAARVEHAPAAPNAVNRANPLL